MKTDSMAASTAALPLLQLAITASCAGLICKLSAPVNAQRTTHQHFLRLQVIPELFDAVALIQLSMQLRA